MSILSRLQVHQAESKAKMNMSPKEALRRANDLETFDENLESILKAELDKTWARIQTQPSSYIMNQTEFGIFNRYRSDSRFQNETARSAVERYWNSKSVANSHWLPQSVRIYPPNKNSEYMLTYQMFSGHPTLAHRPGSPRWASSNRNYVTWMSSWFNLGSDLWILDPRKFLRFGIWGSAETWQTFRPWSCQPQAKWTGCKTWRGIESCGRWLQSTRNGIIS